MHETLTLLLTHVRMVWRFRWLALTVASVVCVVGWSGVVLMPNVYQVTAKVFLDTSSMLRPLLRGLAVDAGTTDTVRMVQRTLLVRPNLETVARKTDMDLQAKTPEEFEELLEGLADRITVSGTTRDNIFVIGFNDSDPQLATGVVEAILNLFVERSLGETRRDAGKTKQFLDKQIAEYEARLNAAENRVKEFKQRNVGMMPEQGSSYFGRLEAMNSKLAAAQLQLDEVVRRRDEFRRQLDGVETLFEPEVYDERPTAMMPHPLDGRIQNLKQQLDQLLLQYTEKHPDVSATRGMIATLEAEREATPVPLPPSQAGEQGGAQNPLASEIELSLRQAEADVAGLTARVEEFTRRTEELKKLVDTVPRIEAELTRLNRDYNVNKRNYDELVKRRESLSLSEQASQTSENVQFNIIDPPRVPLSPVGPDRPLFSAMVLGFGLALGGGLAWLVAMMRPALYSRDEVELAFSIPVIGTVSRTWTRGEVLRRRMEVTTFVVGCMVLVASFSALVTIELHSAELLERVRDADVLQRVVRRMGDLV